MRGEGSSSRPRQAATSTRGWMPSPSTTYAASATIDRQQSKGLSCTSQAVAESRTAMPSDTRPTVSGVATQQGHAGAVPASGGSSLLRAGVYGATIGAAYRLLGGGQMNADTRPSTGRHARQDSRVQPCLSSEDLQHAIQEAMDTPHSPAPTSHSSSPSSSDWDTPLHRHTRYAPSRLSRISYQSSIPSSSSNASFRLMTPPTSSSMAALPVLADPPETPLKQRHTLPSRLDPYEAGGLGLVFVQGAQGEAGEGDFDTKEQTRILDRLDAMLLDIQSLTERGRQALEDVQTKPVDQSIIFAAQRQGSTGQRWQTSQQGHM